MDEPQQDAVRATPLDDKLRRSTLTLLIERLWRLGAALATLALFFVALAWAGVWRAAPLEARILGVALFGFAALYLVVREIVRGWPRRQDALQRLDAAAAPQLRPAASLDDTLAAREADPATAALWALHRKRLARTLARTPVAPPDPRTPERDPYALRALALVAAIAAAFVAGDEKRARLAAAFDWRAAPFLAAASRVDAWFDPPAYTGRPPIVLGQLGGAIEAPVNSLLRLRPAQADVPVSGGLAADEGAEQKSAKERNYRLTGAARLSLPDGRDFDVAAIPDKPPTIVLAEKPRNNMRGSMTLAYHAEDDYGVLSAEAAFGRKGGGHALYEAPRVALALPAGAGGLGDAKATIDLADSPFAGTPLSMRLIAKDGGGGEGASAPVDVVLPQRRFVQPLARALVEQRRKLALSPDAYANVRAALEALALAPEIFESPSAIHLGLRTARRSLEGKRSDDELRTVADMLWAMALSLEDGDASQAERELRDAQQALREALAHGDEEEIARRSQELRAALDKFLQQLGARPSQGQQPRENASDGDSVTPEDLQAMLDEMSKAAQSGDREQAQKLLDELQDILENVQTAENGAAQRSKSKEMQRMLNELDQLSREEQQLRDDTFQGMKNPGVDEQFPQSRANRRQQQQERDASAERDRQQALRERLERQQDALSAQGESGVEELDEARKAMKEAEQALGKNGEGRGRGVDAQGRAVQALRKGADKLAEQMRGEGEDGEGQGTGRSRRRGKGGDPLGRSGNGRNASREKYDPMGLPPAQRAHRVQEELRRRLGQPDRPVEELDYLQRLLRR